MFTRQAEKRLDGTKRILIGGDLEASITCTLASPRPAGTTRFPDVAPCPLPLLSDATTAKVIAIPETCAPSG